MTPQRSSQQATGDEGELAFAASLPKLWVPRTETPDYGIDFDVEIVDPAGGFPGLRFYSQVKTTASTNPREILRIRIELEWLEYYRQLAQPVLLVRYSTHRNHLYVRWAHGVHLHLAQGDPPKVPVVFDDSHLLGNNTADRLVRDVVEFRHWKQNVPAMPLRVGVTSDSDMVAASQMTRTLRNAPNRPHDLFEFHTGRPPIGGISLALSEDKIVLSAAEVSSMTLHFEGAPKHLDSAWLIEATRISLAIVFGNLGRTELANRVLGNSHRLSLFDHSPDVVHRVAELLWEVGNTQGAEALWNRVAYAEHGSLSEGAAEIPELAFAVIGAFFHIAPSLAEDAVRTFLIELDKYAELQNQEGRHLAAAMVYAGVGIAEFHIGRFREAFRAMSRARRLNPIITDDPQFRRDIAATLFELGRYRSAEALYEELFEDSKLAMTLCRLADVQLFAGRYHDSVTTFVRAYELAVGEKQPFESLWMLRHLIAEMAHNSADSQMRNPSAASAALEGGDAETALVHDVLCTAAWSRKAEDQLQAGDERSALVSYAIAAGLDSTRLQDAVQAVALGLELGTAGDPLTEMITLTIIDIGIHRHGVDAFVGAVEEHIENLSDDHDQPRLINALHQVLSDAGGEGSTSTWSDGGRMYVVLQEPEAE